MAAWTWASRPTPEIQLPTSLVRGTWAHYARGVTMRLLQALVALVFLAISLAGIGAAIVLVAVLLGVGETVGGLG